MDGSVRVILRILPFIGLGGILFLIYYLNRDAGWADWFFGAFMVYWIGVVIAWARMTKPYR